MPICALNGRLLHAQPEGHVVGRASFPERHRLAGDAIDVGRGQPAFGERQAARVSGQLTDRSRVVSRRVGFADADDRDGHRAPAARSAGSTFDSNRLRLAHATSIGMPPISG